MAPYTPTRRFVRPDETLDDFARIEPYFQDLAARDVSAPDALERWLLAGSELAACLGEVRTDRYVKMTCRTDDADLARRYLDYVENIEPRCRPLWHDLNVKYAGSPAARQLPAGRYRVLDRSTRAAVELFRQENIPLLTEQAKLAQQYQQVCGAMTVEFDGREQTLPQMTVYGENADRDVRRQAWELTARRRLQNRDRLEDIFDTMLELRRQLAVNADLPDYREYAFRAHQRFDYTPADCLAFHEVIARTAVPAVRAIDERRRRLLGLPGLRPWVLAVDEKGRDRLQPFESAEQLSRQCQTIFDRVDPELGQQFGDMRAKGYLDLESRKCKAPGGYQSTYEESRRPFIFMNAVGLHRDVVTLLHEGGHAFHTFATREEDLIDYRSAPIEFAEVASMGMELLALEHYNVIYEGADLARAKRKHLEGILRLFPWVATIDAFQHWLYTHPGHSRDERRDQWLRLHRRYGGDIDYAGYEEIEGHLWQRQLHLYEAPFYYIEYAIAQLGALQIWRNARRDRAGAVQSYRRALALGGSQPLTDLFAAAGARFDFSIDTVGPLLAAVQEELNSLPAD